VAVTPQSTTVAAIDQLFAVVPPRHKIGALARVLATSDAEASLVFVRTRADAEEVCTGLVARGVAASVISGDVSQNEREKVMERIRSGLVRVLVATDVAARGLDIDTIGMVVNYDLPHDNESYVHRIGRTGRAGRSGIALSFVGPKMLGRINRLESALHVKMTEFHIPTPAEVSAHRITALLNGVPARLSRGRLDVAVNAVNKFIAANPSITDATEIVAAIAAIAVGDTGVALEREESFSSSDSSDRPRKRSFEPRGEGGMKGPRKQFRDDGQGRPFRDRDRDDSPRKSYRDRDEAPRTSYRDRDDAPRSSYRDRDDAARSSYRARDDAPRASYRDRDETPRRPYREEGQDWGTRAPRARQGDDPSRRPASTDRGTAGEPRHESTKPWGRTDHQRKRFTAAPTWKASAKPRKKKH
jgi:superfamily II DNA/RNA helicase